MKDPQHELRDADALELAGEEPAFLGVVLEGKYELQSQLGRGGMGVVYKAWHRLLDRPVAVKMLHAHLVADEQQLLQMRREARLIADLDHPNIVSVQAFGTTPEGAPYVVMELLEGRTLAEILESEKQLSIERTVDLVLQVATALQYSHEKGIIHRDLKPNNIVVCPGENGAGESVKIVDFGIARRDVQSHTVTQVVGTPPYMSPEQCMGKRGTAQADLYSLACVMHECVSGQPPFVGESAIDTLRMHLSAEPPPLKTLRKETPVALQNITLKLLAKDPQARYESASELIADLTALKKFLSGGGAEPTVAVPRPPTAFATVRTIDYRKFMIPALILMLAAAGMAVVSSLRLNEPQAAVLQTVPAAASAKVDDSPVLDRDVLARLAEYHKRIEHAKGAFLGKLPDLFEEALDELDKKPKSDRGVVADGFEHEMLAAKLFLLGNRAGLAAYHADRAAHYAQYKPKMARTTAYVRAMCLFAQACLSSGQTGKALRALDCAEQAITHPIEADSEDEHDYNRVTDVRTQLGWANDKPLDALHWAQVTVGVVVKRHHSGHVALVMKSLNKLGRYEETLQLGQELFSEGFDDDGQARLLASRMMAEAALKLNKPQEAEAFLRQVLASEPPPILFYEQQLVRLDLADLLEKQGRYAEAVVVLERALRLQVNAPAQRELPLGDMTNTYWTLNILRRLKADCTAIKRSADFEKFESELTRCEKEAASRQPLLDIKMPDKVFALPKSK